MSLAGQTAPPGGPLFQRACKPPCPGHGSTGLCRGHPTGQARRQLAGCSAPSQGDLRWCQLQNHPWGRTAPLSLPSLRWPGRHLWWPQVRGPAPSPRGASATPSLSGAHGGFFAGLASPKLGFGERNFKNTSVVVTPPAQGPCTGVGHHLPVLHMPALGGSQLRRHTSPGTCPRHGQTSFCWLLSTRV